jgi:hypothetical protein
LFLPGRPGTAVLTGAPAGDCRGVDETVPGKVPATSNPQFYIQYASTFSSPHSKGRCLPSQTTAIPGFMHYKQFGVLVQGRSADLRAKADNIVSFNAEGSKRLEKILFFGIMMG